MPEIFENAAIFLSTTPNDPLRNRAFQKLSSLNRGNLKRPALLIRRKKELFENDVISMVTWFPFPCFAQTQSQNDRLLSVFNFIQRFVDGKHLMRFQIENALFKFLERRVDGVKDANIKTIGECFFQCILRYTSVSCIIALSQQYVTVH